MTTFTSMDEAVAKLASGEVSFDVFFPTPDHVGQLAAAKLLQPLNKSYFPNLATSGSRCGTRSTTGAASYTVPYTVYTTGIGYRVDAVGKAPRDTTTRTTSSGTRPTPVRSYLLEDDREALGMALLRRRRGDGRQHRGPGRRSRALADALPS